MKEYNKDGIKFNYRGYLTEEEVKNIVRTYLSILTDTTGDYNDMLGFTDLNILSAELAFDRIIGIICIENFTDELYEELFNHGVFDFLRVNIINADKAYILATEISQKADSFISIAKSLLPENINVEELMANWQKVSDGYKDIVSDKKEE